MKTLFLLFLGFFAQICVALPPDRVAVEPDTVSERGVLFGPRCSFAPRVFPHPPLGKLVKCEKFGVLGKPSPIGNSPGNVTSIEACRDFCYIRRGHCESLSYNIITHECIIYNENLIQQKFSKVPLGDVVYSNRRCYKKACTPPVAPPPAGPPPAT